MAWYLNRALTNFRNEVNARWPNRDKTSDGTIGDEAHQNTSSDHNPDSDGSVDAWDMDVDGVDVWACINAAVLHPAIQYIIYNRKITSRSKPGGLGVWHSYSGANPHDKHVHFNTRSSHESSTAPWFPPLSISQEALMAVYEEVSGLYAKLLYENWAPTRAEWIAAGGPAATYDLLAANGSGRNELALAIKRIEALLVSIAQAQGVAQADIDDIQTRTGTVNFTQANADMFAEAVISRLPDSETVDAETVKRAMIEVLTKGTEPEEEPPTTV